MSEKGLGYALEGDFACDDISGISWLSPVKIFLSLSSLCDKTYAERLTLLSLPSLQYRRLKGDLIFLYKVLNNYLILIFLIYIPNLQLLLLGGISSNCSRIVQGCCVD